MSLTLLPASPSDIPEIIAIYFAAFQTVFSLNRFPRTPNVRTWWEKYLHGAFTNDHHVRFLKIVKEDKIIAFAEWSMPIEEAEGSDKHDKMPEWPKDGDTELCAESFRVMVATRRELMGWRPHFFLEMLATSPEHQGQGAGGMLIRWGLEQADQMGLEAYVEASPVGVPVYRRFGWEEKKSAKFLDGKHTEVFMVRPAVGKRIEL